jgi:hypothetical protein
VVDADRTGRDPGVLHTQSPKQVLAHRTPGLLAQTPHLAGRIVAGQRRQVDAGHSFQQPSGLVRLFQGPSRTDARRPTLHSAAVDADRCEAIGIEIHAWITSGAALAAVDDPHVVFGGARHNGYSSASRGR